MSHVPAPFDHRSRARIGTGFGTNFGSIPKPDRRSCRGRAFTSSMRAFTTVWPSRVSSVALSPSATKPFSRNPSRLRRPRSVFVPLARRRSSVRRRKSARVRAAPGRFRRRRPLPADGSSALRSRRGPVACGSRRPVRGSVRSSRRAQGETGRRNRRRPSRSPPPPGATERSLVRRVGRRVLCTLDTCPVTFDAPAEPLARIGPFWILIAHFLSIRSSLIE